ncbi:hypothetical protein BLA29_000092 [Euroglyphus maynei]|uniref:ER-bound oxygenase mpaB/mpaB'/Rubber oxygenase catalytic domain-containing protein n=1 Tax=Euroglyphus maynei TaxID=6958 RepID=A0A1Y3AWH0_EURMA|nr:hypothetical protein BLA29_000092 [Euroglyphus maynei]
MDQNNLVEKVRARRLMISDEGKMINGISDDINTDKAPKWFNQTAFLHAQKLFKTYGAIIRISQFYGLLLVLHDPHGAIPLLCTGNSRTVSKLFRRYLSTIIRVNDWFKDDPFNTESDSYRQLRTVRRMHKSVSKKMNENSHYVENEKHRLWIAQYGMCIAQFSFVGFMAIFPKELGFHNFTKEDFHSMFHFWRLIGYCLGMDDRYNLCDGTDEETVEFCRQIYFEQWLPAIKSHPYVEGLAMSRGICLAMSEIDSSLNFNLLMNYGAPFLQLNADDFPLTKQEKISYYNLKMFYNYGSKFVLMNWMATKYAQLSIDYAIKNRDKIENRLQQKYAHLKYENPSDRCPFNINIHYSDAF